MFDRKFDRGLVGDRPGSKPPLYLELRKKKSAMRLKKVIVIVFWMEFPAISRDLHSRSIAKVFWSVLYHSV